MSGSTSDQFSDSSVRVRMQLGHHVAKKKTTVLSDSAAIEATSVEPGSYWISFARVSWPASVLAKTGVTAGTAAIKVASATSAPLSIPRVIFRIQRESCRSLPHPIGVLKE